MMEEEYRIERRMNWLMMLCGIILLAAGVGTLALPWLAADSHSRGQLVFVLLTGPAYLTAGCYCLRIVLRGQDYGVALGPGGFRRLSDSPARVVGWPRVAGLRECRLTNRVELLDHAGRVLGRLEFQLERFEQALAMVLEATRYERRFASVPQRIEAGGALANRLAWILLLGLGALSFGYGLQAPALLLFGVLAWAFLKDRRTTRQGVYLDGTAVRLTTGAGAVNLPLDQLDDVRVVRKPMGNGGYLLDVAVTTRSGEVYLARPGAADPFLVWATLRAARHRGRLGAAPGPSAPPAAVETRQHRSWRIAGLTALLCGLFLAGLLRERPPRPVPGIGTQAPEFRARDLLTGREVSMPELGRSHVVVLSFWDHGCRYCRGQLAALDSVRGLVDSSRVRIVAIHIENAAAGVKFVHDLHLGVELWQDVDDLVARRYGIEGTPATLIVDTTGCIRYFVTGTGGVNVERLARAANSAATLPPGRCEGSPQGPSGSSRADSTAQS